MQKLVHNCTSILLVAMVITAKAQSSPTPELEFALELKVSVDTMFTLGLTPYGERRIIPITGGTFEGPGLKGKVLPGGADYQFVNEEGTRTSIEAIYTIQTNDGYIIHIRNRGVVFKTEKQASALAAGETVNWEDVYFRAAPVFEAPENSPYAWMNNAIFVCKGIPGPTGSVSIIVWKVR